MTLVSFVFAVASQLGLCENKRKWPITRYREGAKGLCTKPQTLGVWVFLLRVIGIGGNG